jgi:hypothetical protein
MGTYVWLLPEVSGRVAGGIGRMMADRMGQDCGRTLVGVTLLYVEGPAAGGGEPAVVLVKTRAMV